MYTMAFARRTNIRCPMVSQRVARATPWQNKTQHAQQVMINFQANMFIPLPLLWRARRLQKLQCLTNVHRPCSSRTDAYSLDHLMSHSTRTLEIVCPMCTNLKIHACTLSCVCLYVCGLCGVDPGGGWLIPAAGAGPARRRGCWWIDGQQGRERHGHSAEDSAQTAEPVSPRSFTRHR